MENIFQKDAVEVVFLAKFVYMNKKLGLTSNTYKESFGDVRKLEGVLNVSASKKLSVLKENKATVPAEDRMLITFNDHHATSTTNSLINDSLT